MTDSEAVTLWRKQFKLNLSPSWKEDVDKTVTNIQLWREILANWCYYKNGRKIKKSPGIKQLLDEYERQSINRELEASNQRNDQAEALSTRSRERLSQRSDSEVRQVWSKPPSQYFRTR